MRITQSEIQKIPFDFKNAEKIKLPEDLIDFINKIKNKKGNLIMVLHKVQQKYGYIPREVAKKLSQLLSIPLAKIYGVATFYHFFKLEKTGKYIIQVCMGTACYLKGAQDILDEFGMVLGIDPGETTKNELFSLESVRCLGCCSIAPVVKIGSKMYNNVTKDNIPEIISNYINKQ